MKIGVVIVTYNRLLMLKKALDAFETQTFRPAYVVVVNNASSDGTEDFLGSWKEKSSDYQKYVINQEANQGGSGGFYSGLHYVLSLDADWIWVSDDDALPKEDALEVANAFLENNCGNLDISAICGAVYNKGVIDTGHRKNVYTKGLKICYQKCPVEYYEKETFELNAFSYVGTILSKKKMEAVGITRKDYFIWFDDTEHSVRLSKVGKIICVPAIQITHDVDEANASLSWKHYYGIRNEIDFFRSDFGKKYYYYRIIFMKLRVLMMKLHLSKTSRVFKELYISAMNDAIHKHFGIHATYKPGWKPEE